MSLPKPCLSSAPRHLTLVLRPHPLPRVGPAWTTAVPAQGGAERWTWSWVPRQPSPHLRGGLRGTLIGILGDCVVPAGPSVGPEGPAGVSRVDSCQARPGHRVHRQVRREDKVAGSEGEGGEPSKWGYCEAEGMATLPSCISFPCPSAPWFIVPCRNPLAPSAFTPPAAPQPLCSAYPPVGSPGSAITCC